MKNPVAARRPGLSTVLTLALSVALLAGCEQQVKAPRKAPPLAPPDLSAQRAAAAEATQLFDKDGNLLPSSQMVAGVRLPRGMREELHVDRQWYFRSRASTDQLRRYFGPRLLTGQVERVGKDTVTYVDATPKDGKTDAPVSVRIEPAANDPKASSVRISQPSTRKGQGVVSFHEAQRQLQNAQRYAD